MQFGTNLIAQTPYTDKSEIREIVTLMASLSAINFGLGGANAAEHLDQLRRFAHQLASVR